MTDRIKRAVEPDPEFVWIGDPTQDEHQDLLYRGYRFIRRTERVAEGPTGRTGTVWVYRKRKAVAA